MTDTPLSVTAPGVLDGDVDGDPELDRVGDDDDDLLAAAAFGEAARIGLEHRAIALRQLATVEVRGKRAELDVQWTPGEGGAAGRGVVTAFRLP